MRRYLVWLVLVVLAGCAGRTANVPVKVGTLTVCSKCRAVIRDATQTITVPEDQKGRCAAGTVYATCARCAQAQSAPVQPTTQQLPPYKEEPPLPNMSLSGTRSSVSAYAQRRTFAQNYQPRYQPTQPATGGLQGAQGWNLSGIHAFISNRIGYGGKRKKNVQDTCIFAPTMLL